MPMKKFVWDASALVNIKEPNGQGYSPGHSLFKDLTDGWIPGPYQNIFPAIAAFELDATVSKLHRKGKPILRDFFIVDENAVVYPVDRVLIGKCASLVEQPEFSRLHGADLIYACIAHIEDAYLVTLDKHFDAVASVVKVLNLNESKDSPLYRKFLGL